MNSRIRNLGTALLLWGWLALLPQIAAAQQARIPSGTPQTADADQPADQDQQYNFSVEIQVVAVPVTVTDQKGQFVTDLDQRDFTVLDNGEPQKIENFELSSEPLSLAVVVETSSRVQSLLPEVKGAGILMTQLVLGETGEAAVLSFDREVKIIQDFTDSSDKIEAAMRNLQAGADQTHLSDAVARAIFLLQQRPRGRRKVIIAISEARDQGSNNHLGYVLRGAQQLGISVYTIGLSTMKALFGRPAGEGAPSSPYPPGVVARPMPGGQLPTPDAQSNMGAANVNLLEIITDLVTYTRGLLGANPLSIYAAGTGGTDFPSDSKAKLEKALSRIGEELRNQYLLTYRPSNLDNPGFHSIQVIVSRRNLEARFRPGYMFTPPIRGSSPSLQAPSPSPHLPAEDPGPAGQ